MSSVETSRQDEIAQTRQRIQQLLGQIAELARQEISSQEFFRLAVGNTVSAMSAVGGAAFTLSGNRLELQYQQQMPPELAAPGSPHAAAHHRLLQRALEHAAGIILPPQSGDAVGGGLENPTSALLLIARVMCRRQPAGLLCIYGRPDSAPAARQGLLQFVRAVAEHVEIFLLLQGSRAESSSQALLPVVEQFVQAAHAGLDLRGTCEAIANEGRRLLGCDRVCVAVRTRRRFSLEAVSGQDVIERRSTLVRRLEELVSETAGTGRVFRYAGSTEGLAPELVSTLESYLHESSARRVDIVPLARRAPLPAGGPEGPVVSAAQAADRETVVGAMVIEQFEGGAELPEGRLDLIARHASSALANAVEYRRIPLRWLWGSLAAARRIPDRSPVRRFAAAIALGAILIGVGVIPATHTVIVDGRLQPMVRQVIAAGEPGIVSRWPAEEGPVAAGALLVELQNAELETAVESVESQLIALRAWEAAAAGEPPETSAARKAFDQQLALLERDAARLRARREQLKIASPRAGRVELLRPPQELIGRRVDRGEPLLAVYSSNDGWRVECPVTEHVLETVRTAQATASTALAVRVEIPAASETVEGATLAPFTSPARFDPVQGQSLSIVVPAGRGADWQAGWPATAEIDCGKRAAAYVWLDRLRRSLYARVASE